MPLACFTVALESARNQVTTASGIDGCEIGPTAPGTIGGAVLAAQMPPRRPDSATPATWSNSQRSGAAPSRARALVTEPVRAGRVHFSPARRGTFSSSSRSTRRSHAR